ncbi:etoposide-induced protein 2.4-domain-containing protein [Zychaea mexicana]|uniref:etoposide-induced protein 2.4-domain-containing protein n=1 Tax=Zychaea mexicana TaxID=64656 RepID=UPI0022FF1CE6|nr:etoposide-induced protein 2.4-domain-containing protein [Zychaea mexicana]KAI9498005.1 etoposide-induced protein 2.4-domain-containing protein [Zychaea mexicana]
MATSTQSPLSQHWNYFLNGAEQAFNWPKTFILFYSSSTVQKSMFKALFINGIIFLGGVLFLEIFYNAPEHRIFGCSYATITGFPLYFGTLGINGKFFTPIAEKAFQLQAKNNPRTTPGSTNIVQSMASMIYTVIFYMNCGVFAGLLRSMIPHVGTLLAFLMNCAIMSYYCFEYKWLYMGWTLEQRMTFMEEHWAYFLGFGTPITVLTFFLSTLHSGAVFAILYPSYVIMATMATPKPATPYGQPLASGKTVHPELSAPNKIPLFFGVRKMNDLVIFLAKMVGGVHADSIVSEKQKMTKME